MAASPDDSADRTSFPFTPTQTGISLRVRLTPRSSRDEIGKVFETPEGPAIQARVRALPADNAANDALIRLIAKSLRVPKSAVKLIAGGKSRLKTLSIVGTTETLVDGVLKMLQRP